MTGASLSKHGKAALGQQGAKPVAFSLLSPLGPGKGTRLSWRVDCADGRTLKVREFASEAEAVRVREIRARLDPAFAPVLAQHGSVLIEQWIDGAPFPRDEPTRYLEDAGILLGRLHTTPLDRKVFPRCPTRGWAERAESDMKILTEAGVLAYEEADILCAELHGRDPVSDCNVIIHVDFCAENLIVDKAGALRVIDNEHVAVGPAGFDLGCSFHRWPMSSSDWQRFCLGYRSVASEPSAVVFWRVAAAIMGARVNLQFDPQRLDSSLTMLRGFAAGKNLETGF